MMRSPTLAELSYSGGSIDGAITLTKRKNFSIENNKSFF